MRCAEKLWRFFRLTFAVVALGGSAAMAPGSGAAAAEVELYGGVGFGFGPPPNRGALLLLDQATAAGTLIGTPVSGVGLSGLAFLSGGRLFGSTVAGLASTSFLVEIDRTSGAAISSVPILLDGITPIRIHDLAVQPGSAVIYGSDLSSLYRISLSGTATLVGDAGTNIAGLAFAPDGTLYATHTHCDNPRLLTLDPANAAVLSSIATSGAQPSMDGLAVRPSDGAIFGTGSGACHNEDVATVNPVTGVTTAVGDTGLGPPADLAFFALPPPVPDISARTALAVVGFLAVLLFAMTRRHPGCE